MNKISFALVLTCICIVSSCKNNEPVLRTSIAGAWMCEEFNPLIMGGSRRYIVDVERERTDTTKYVIFNFHNAGDDEFVRTTYKNKILTITEQPLGIGMTVRSGNGSASADFKRMDITYTIFDGMNEVEVNAVYSRK